MKLRIFINNLTPQTTMNLDSTQINAQVNHYVVDSISFEAIDSSISNKDSILCQTDGINHIGRFLRENELSQNLHNHLSTEMVPEWITYLVLGGFVLLAILNFSHRKSLLLTFKSTISISQTNLFIREANPFRKRPTLIFALIYVISIPLLFYFGIEHFASDTLKVEFSPSFFFNIALIVIGFFLYKWLFIQFTALIFQTQKISSDLLLNILIFNFIIGVLILPIIAFYIYTQMNIFIFTGLFIYGIGIFMRLLRELSVGMTHSIFSKLHLFLYLCTLEFIPVVIVVKILTNFYFR